MPTLSEYQEVIDWKAVTVLAAIDGRQGASVERLISATELDRDVVTDRCAQLSALGLIAEHDVSDGDGTRYELTGAGHGVVGAGLYDAFDLVGDADIDDLAARVAELRDRRDELRAEAQQLSADAEDVRSRAERLFDDRGDVTAELEALLADLDSLAESLADEESQSP